MRSATSFFDKTLVRTDVRRYWPLLFVYTAFWLLLLPVVQWSELPHVTYAGRYIYDTMIFALVAAVAIGLLMAMALYSYLMNSRSVGLMHSLPVTRHTQFFSHFFAGMGMLTVGKIIVVLASLAVQMLHHNVDVKATLLWFVVATLLELLFFSLGILCCMLTGWLLAAPVIYAAANCFVLLLTLLLRALGDLFYFGYHSGSMPAITRWLTPVYVLGEELGETGYVDYNGGMDWEPQPPVMNSEVWPPLLFYTVLALVFLALAYFLYRKRASESASDPVAFGWARPVFRYGIAVYGGLFFGYGLYSLLELNGDGSVRTVKLLICVVLMGALWSFAAEMLIRKTFRVFRSGWKGAAILSAVLVLVCVAVRMDITGYETRVPDPDKVVSVDVNLSHEGVRVYDGTDPETIAMALELHEAIVTEGRAAEGAEEIYRINISYELKSGAVLSRHYLLSLAGAKSSDRIYNAAKKMMATEEIRLYTVFGNYHPDISQIRGGYLNSRMTSDLNRQLTVEEAKTLYRAILTDLDSGAGAFLPMQPVRLYSSVYIELDTGANTVWIDSVSPDFTNTVAVLEDLGIKPEEMWVDDYGKYIEYVEAAR